MPIVNSSVAASTMDTVLASAARTTTGAGTEVAGFEAASALVVQLEVTASGGVTPTLDVVLQDSVDGTNWNTVATFAQAVGTTRAVQRVTTPFSNKLRASYTIAGTTPSFTFSVKSYART